MELYHNNMSVCSQKVRLVLREKGLSPTEHHLNLRAGESHTPEYLKLNPKGVVPTLIDHDRPIIESTVICEYLDDAYPQAPLRPKDPLLRATMRLFTQTCDTGVHMACATVSFSIAFRFQNPEPMIRTSPNPAAAALMRVIVEKGVDAPMVPGAVKTYDKLLADMNHQLESTTWLAGGEYSLAETALVPYVLRLEHLNLAWMYEDKRTPVARWLERCKSRPNYAGVSNYIDPHYLEVMQPNGLEVRDKIKAMLAG